MSSRSPATPPSFPASFLASLPRSMPPCLPARLPPFPYHAPLPACSLPPCFFAACLPAPCTLRGRLLWSSHRAFTREGAPDELEIGDIRIATRDQLAGSE
eukprot:GHVU01123985.1.p2 GENE.GHVU01123985.1~~GHVU01123985.1.p2  ORF type:complete len:100 (+),score=4.47 GHVU01123985.1:299-598(+)